MATRATRLALALWIAWAVIVWNVVFDRVIVVAGRKYVYAAVLAASRPSTSYARIDDWLGPAVPRAFWSATAAGGIILAIGLVGLRVALRQPRSLPQRVPGPPS